jgi:hypothetical protein
MLMCPHVRRIDRQQVLDVLNYPGIDSHYRLDLGEHGVVSAIEGPSVMALPHRLLWSEIGWQIPPWATSAESPRDPFQYQTVVAEPVASLAFIRWHQRFDSRPKLIRNHTHSRHRPIVAAQRILIRETRPSPDEVSAAISVLLSEHGQASQAVAAQAVAFLLLPAGRRLLVTQV